MNRTDIAALELVENLMWIVVEKQEQMQSETNTQSSTTLDIEFNAHLAGIGACACRAS